MTRDLEDHDPVMTEAVTRFVMARLDEEEWWAREASRTWRGDTTPTGEHWRWETTDNDTPVTPDPVADEFVGQSLESFTVGLRSVEEYSHDGELPLAHLCFSADEVQSTVGGHIIRNDPAATLHRVAATRVRIEYYALLFDDRRAALMRLEALAWEEHPDYNHDWAVVR